jgi:hypothetical protein
MGLFSYHIAYRLLIFFPFLCVQIVKYVLVICLCLIRLLMTKEAKLWFLLSKETLALKIVAIEVKGRVVCIPCKRFLINFFKTLEL